MWISPTEMKSCLSKGKATCIYRDGSTRTDEFTADCEPGPDGKLVFEGHSVFIGGTGRFDGTKGTISWTSRSLTEAPNEIGFTTKTLEFTLPKK